MLGVVICLRAHMRGVLTCLRAYVLACLRAWHAYILGVFTCLRVYVFSMLACFVSLCAHMFYMLAVLNYLTCLRACVLLWHRSFYFLCIWKVNFQKFLYRKIYFYLKKYAEPTWTSMTGFFFCEKELNTKTFSLFSRKR